MRAVLRYGVIIPYAHPGAVATIGTLNFDNYSSREATENGEIKLVSVKTQHQCADIFTKSLIKDKFEWFRETIRGAVAYQLV